jgi:hypothetical protein
MMVEMGLAKHMDEIWVFGCTENIAIPRLLRRGSYYMEARQRIDSQIPLQERVKYADLVIDTSAPIELNQQIIKSRLKEIEANIVGHDLDSRLTPLPCSVGCKICLPLELRMERARRREITVE